MTTCRRCGYGPLDDGVPERIAALEAALAERVLECDRLLDHNQQACIRAEQAEDRAQAAESEAERLRAGGCARDQRLTQHCAEAEEQRQRAEQYRQEMHRMADTDAGKAREQLDQMAMELEAAQQAEHEQRQRADKAVRLLRAVLSEHHGDPPFERCTEKECSMCDAAEAGYTFLAKREQRDD